MIRVLLIEEEDDCIRTRDLLNQVHGRSYRLDWVRDCDAARAALRRGGYDVALIDHRLPGCTGLELIEAAQVLCCSFPLLLLTDRSDTDLDRRAMKAGVSEFLVKSTLDADRLDRAIRYAIEHKRAENELRHLHTELEQRVRDRTAELETANRSLQAEVAERTRLEGELRRRLEQMAEEDQRKNEFLDVLGHELRNPLTPIVNALEIARRNGDSEHVGWARGLIERQVRHLIRLVDDLLDVSRIRHGKIALRCERTSLAQAVEQALEARRSLLDERGIGLSVQMPVAPVYVDADPTRLEQVMANLLHNAARYTPAGGKVDVSVSEEQGQGVIRVRDNGAGISGDILPHLFDLFYRGQPGKTGSQSIGLGLMLVKRMVELHGGTVEAHSDGPGQGAEFCIRLLLASEGVREVGPSLLTPHPLPLTPSALRVLVVDDNTQAADTLVQLLSLEGYDVRAAYDVQSALQTASSFRPQCALLDLALSDEIDGYQLAQRIRATPGLENTTLIALTGFGGEQYASHSRQLGFRHHITKPIELERLLRIFEGLSQEIEARSPMKEQRPISNGGVVR